MARVALEIIVNSACDLEDVRLFAKMKVYAVVLLSTNPQKAQQTHVDLICGTSPSWNTKMKFFLDLFTLQQQSNVHLVFHLKCKRTLGDKLVGVVRVPVRELLTKAAQNSNGSFKALTYPVLVNDNGRKGTLSFSYRFARAASAAMENSKDNSAYTMRLQELGLAVNAASLVEKLCQSDGSDVSGSFLNVEDLLNVNADLLTVDPSLDEEALIECLEQTVDPSTVAEGLFSFLDFI